MRMGWDFVTYGDRHACLQDMQLWALRRFLSDAAESLATEGPKSAPFEQAKAFFESWDWLGPGVMVGVELNGFVQGVPDRAQVLARVCDRACDRLRTFGEVVPLAYLEAHINADSPGGVYWIDQPTAEFIRGVERIRGLLVSDAEPNAAHDLSI